MSAKTREATAYLSENSDVEIGRESGADISAVEVLSRFSLCLGIGAAACSPQCRVEITRYFMPKTTLSVSFPSLKGEEDSVVEEM